MTATKTARLLSAVMFVYTHTQKKILITALNGSM